MVWSHNDMNRSPTYDSHHSHPKKKYQEYVVIEKELDNIFVKGTMTSQGSKEVEVQALLNFLSQRNVDKSHPDVSSPLTTPTKEEKATTKTKLCYIPSVAGVAQSLDQTQGGCNQSVSVPVQNARLLQGSRIPTLERQGFQLVSQTIQAYQVPRTLDSNDGVTNPTMNPKKISTPTIDFHSDHFLTNVYHPLVKELLFREIPGIQRVEIFDDTRRSASADARFQQRMREPSATVHNDYTPDSGIWRLQGFMQAHSYSSDEHEELLQHRWWIVNVWRSMGGTVQDYPLVLCDEQTVDAADVVPVERKTATRRGEIQMAMYNPQQQWYYFPQLQADEAILVKTFDSQSFCKAIHSSFHDPTAPSDAAPRESIETRCFVFF